MMTHPPPTPATRRGPFLGGPGTCLPFAVESALGWALAVSCLSVSGYHYIVGTFVWPWMESVWMRRLYPLVRMLLTASSNDYDNKKEGGLLSLPCWLQLTTHSRNELDRATPMQRYQQLLRLLSKETIYGKEEKMDANGAKTAKTNEKPLLCQLDEQYVVSRLDEDQLVELVRKDPILRRLASLSMRPSAAADGAAPLHHRPLAQRLIRIWGRLLELPPPTTCPHENGEESKANGRNESQPRYGYEVSIIVPCRGEDGKVAAQKLATTLGACSNPQSVELVIVNGGLCKNLDEDTLKRIGIDKKVSGSPRWWGNVRVLDFRASQATGRSAESNDGRGPCLNFGAHHAQGRVLAFLHADTRLPDHWDDRLRDMLSGERGDRCSCAYFGFGIDSTPVGLQGGHFPPGVHAIEQTANLRCWLWSLPYGDQCLCLEASVFHAIGGFPHQPIMEDYEVVQLLRQRTALLPKFSDSTREGLRRVPGPPAMCSPRRWQKYGVLHVTFTNSKLVTMYKTQNAPPHEIYRFYYGQSLPPEAQTALSPWEKELEARLGSN